MSAVEVPPEQMSREDLEEELADLRERVEHLEEMVEIRGADSIDEATVEDIWICGVPFGKMLHNTKNRSQKNGREIDEIDAENAESSSISREARSEMVEVHRKLIDWREGADSSLSTNQERGVVLFRQFIRNLDDSESMTGVSAEYGKFKIKSDRAAWILDDAELLPESGKSMAKKRAMKKAVQMSKVQDCDCSGNCDHALLHFHNDDSYVLSVDQDDWMQYVASVQSAIDGVDVQVDRKESGAAADDGETPEEAVAEESERIYEEAAREDEVANTVVSGSEESVLAGGGPPEEEM